MIKKEAENKYPVIDVIKKRWSPVGFSDKPVEKEKLQSLFEAARWAPSCYNEQPWNFIFGLKGDETYEKIFNLLMDGNKPWNKKVPVLILGFVKKTFSRNETENRHAVYDLGQAVGNINAQATADGLVLHQMAGFDTKKSGEVFAFTENHEAIVVISVGYQEEENKISESLLEREKGKRSRKDFKEFVFGNRLGEKSDLF